MPNAAGAAPRVAREAGERLSQRFDPYAILGELEAGRVAYVLIGGLARVLQGSDEDTRGVDLVPSLRPANLDCLSSTLERLDAKPRHGGSLRLGDASETVTLDSPAGELIVVRAPVGTRGYEDLRRKAGRLHLGEGLRPLVAAPGDLVRMLEALGRPEHGRVAETMRRVVELDRSPVLER